MSAWNVTYGRWAESYDRGMARRASLERRERLELEREENNRRQRAEEEFQVHNLSCTIRAAAAVCTPKFDPLFSTNIDKDT